MSSIKSFDAYVFEGYPFVNVQVEYGDDLTGDIRDDIELGTGITGLTPRQARTLAIDLLTTADRVDAADRPIRRAVSGVSPRKRVVSLMATGDEAEI
jgi:hypothetical protein